MIEPSEFLAQNFLCYDGKGEVPSQIHAYLSGNFKKLRNLPKDDYGLRTKARDPWYVPDSRKAGDLDELRTRALLREFDEYRHSTQRRLKLFRLEAIRAGFRTAWQARDYVTIIEVARKDPGGRAPGAPGGPEAVDVVRSGASLRMRSSEGMYWLQSHYNLICYGHSDIDVFRGNSGASRFPNSRMFEFTDAHLSEHYKRDLSKLAELPTLVVAEAMPNGNARTPAFLSRIDGVHQSGSEIAFQFRHLYGGMSSEDVFGLEGLLLGPWEHSRTHWAVKDGNLLETLFRHIEDESKRRSPKLFTTHEWPLPPLGHVAVMMPFSRDFDTVHETIKIACGDVGLATRRVDEIYGLAKIMDDIFSTIAQSQVVVSDLTGRNPNVLYETGLAHALDRDVVTIVQNDEDVPFDLKHIRFIKYLQNTEGLGKLRVELRETLRGVCDWDRSSPSPFR